MFQILIYFLCENCNPPSPPPPPLEKSNPPLKVEVLPSPPPFFENLVGGSTTSLSQAERGGAHYALYFYNSNI